MIGAYERTSRDGHVLNYRTLEMLLVAERRYLAWLGLTGGEVVLSQGSYTTASPASAGTHAGGGALDVDATSWDTAGGRDRIVLELRLIGFAAWYRPRRFRADGSLLWNPHIHAIAIGDRELSAAAADQVADYYAGRNGLADNGPDTGPRVEFTVYPQQLQELWMTPDEVRAAVWSAPIKNPETGVELTARAMLQSTYVRVARIATRQAAIEAKLDEVAKSAELDPAELGAIAANAELGAKRALDEIDTLRVIIERDQPTTIEPPPPPA